MAMAVMPRLAAVARATVYDVVYLSGAGGGAGRGLVAQTQAVCWHQIGNREQPESEYAQGKAHPKVPCWQLWCRPATTPSSPAAAGPHPPATHLARTHAIRDKPSPKIPPPSLNLCCCTDTTTKPQTRNCKQAGNQVRQSKRPTRRCRQPAGRPNQRPKSAPPPPKKVPPVRRQAPKRGLLEPPHETAPPSNKGALLDHARTCARIQARTQALAHARARTHPMCRK